MHLQLNIAKKYKVGGKGDREKAGGKVAEVGIV